MTRKLLDALQIQKKKTQKYNQPIYGSLGISLGGEKLVEVPNRNSYVYVRLRDNQSELIQAFNNRVAPSYGLPVIVERRGNRYMVMEVNTERYENNWTSFSPFLPRHGNTHSFDTESGGGGDVVWVYPRQLMPSLIIPSGSLGAPNVIMSSYALQKANGTWQYTGITGTQNITPYRPTSPSGTTLVLVYLDATTGNPGLLFSTGTYVSSIITGASQLTPYFPATTSPTTQIPLSVIRLVTGTTVLRWDNIYDVRQWIHTTPTGTGGGGSVTIATGTSIQDEGVPLGTVNTLNFVGANVDVTVSGSVARVHVTGTSGGVSNLTGTYIGTPNKLVLSSSAGFLTTEPSLGWGLAGLNGFIDFGANVAGKEANAGKVGYQLFDPYFDIVGAGTGSGLRTVQIYDNLRVSSNIRAGSVSIDGIVSQIIGTDATGTIAGVENYAGSGTYGRKDKAWASVIPENGWIFVTENWTRTGDHSFAIIGSGNLSTRYRKGTKVMYNDPALEFGSVGSVAVTGSNTFVNLIPNTDFAMANTFISGRYISYIENPEEYPGWFNFDANPQGFSSPPSSPSYQWFAVGETLFINYSEPNNGTSNATTFTASLPIASPAALSVPCGVLVDNGALLTTAGRFNVAAGGTTINFRTNMGNGAWTAANGKRATVEFFYAF